MDQICNASLSLLKTSANWTVVPLLNLVSKEAGSANSAQQIILKETIYTLPPNMRKWVTVAGLMGASAVSIGAFGSHVLYPRKEIPDSRKAVFETANKYHFISSLALIGVPFARKSGLTGTLFITGTLIFCGSCYYYAITDNKNVSKYAPYGGATLILAWLSLAL